MNRVHDPERVAAVSRAGDALIDAGDLEGAERMLTAWIDGHAGEDTYVARLELGRVLFWRGRTERARALLEPLLEERPDDGWVASFLGQVLARRGDHERARALFEAARQLDGGNHEARLFLGGDDLGDAERARRLLTHGALPPRGCIDFAAMCAALDFRRGRRVDLATGELTQAWFDRTNLYVDLAEVGDDVEAELSLRGALAGADRLVFYTSHALGDTLLGLSALDALAAFFRFHPELARPIDVVSPYAAVLAGVADHYPGVRVERLCAPRDPDEALVYAADLAGRGERTLVLCSSAPAVTAALAAVARAQPEVTAVVDLLIDRYARGLTPWQSVRAPRRRIDSYPARLHRFLEILLGCKLRERPDAVAVTLPLSPEISGRRELLTRRLGLAGAAYDVVVESVSKRSKSFPPRLLGDLLGELAQARAAFERAGAPLGRVVLSRERGERGLSPEVAQLPDELRARIVSVDEDLTGMAALMLGAESVIAPDTGLAHLGAVLGRPTVILYSAADPWLWRAGGDHVRALYAPEALAAHVNLTPVNMQEWEAERSLMADSIGVDEVLDAWRRVRSTRDRQLVAGEER